MRSRPSTMSQRDWYDKEVPAIRPFAANQGAPWSPGVSPAAAPNAEPPKSLSLRAAHLFQSFLFAQGITIGIKVRPRRRPRSKAALDKQTSYLLWRPRFRRGHAIAAPTQGKRESSRSKEEDMRLRSQLFQGYSLNVQARSVTICLRTFSWASLTSFSVKVRSGAR